MGPSTFEGRAVGDNFPFLFRKRTDLFGQKFARVATNKSGWLNRNRLRILRWEGVLRLFLRALLAKRGDDQFGQHQRYYFCKTQFRWT